MNKEAANILARALEKDASDQENGSFPTIGDCWDDVYGELLPIENDIENPIYGLAFRFWDDWCDAANHNWQYHEPVKEHQWPEYAREIAKALRSEALPSNEIILAEFLPQPKESWLKKTKKWLARNT